MYRDFHEAWAGGPHGATLTRAEAAFMWQRGQASSGDILALGSNFLHTVYILARLGRQVHYVDPKVDDALRIYTDLRSRGLRNVHVHATAYDDWAIQAVGFVYLESDGSVSSLHAQLAVARCCDPEMCCVRDNLLGMDVHAAIERVTTGELLASLGQLHIYKFPPAQVCL